MSKASSALKSIADVRCGVDVYARQGENHRRSWCKSYMIHRTPSCKLSSVGIEFSVPAFLKGEALSSSTVHYEPIVRFEAYFFGSRVA